MEDIFSDGLLELPNGVRILTRGDDIVASVRKTLRRLQPYLPEDKRGRGVSVCVIPYAPDFPTLLPSTWEEVGPIYWEKRPIYHQFSHEKAYRTLTRPGHVLSWQSRSDALERYQGAARSSLRAIGGSDLPSPADETIAIEALVDIDDITREEADLMAAISDNEYYRLLRAA